MSYSLEVLADSPGAYWRMNEASGQPQDSSGNGNHTVGVSGTPIYSQPGLISDPSARSIRLEAASVEYFWAADSATLSYADTFTLEAWVKRASLSAAEEGLVVRLSQGGGMYLEPANTLMIAKSEVAVIANSTTTIADTTNAHHVVVTKNGATTKLYIDGVDRTGAVTDATCVDNDQNVWIGIEGPGYASFDGYISEVAVYPTALSAARIQAHYVAAFGIYGAAVLADAPRAWYRMDESSGNIQDLSGNANNATGTQTADGSITFQQAGAIGSDPNSKSILVTDAWIFDVPHQTSLNLGDVCSIEFWLKWSTAPSAEAWILSKQTNAYEVRHSASGAIEVVKSDVGIICTATSAVPNDGIFHHCVVTKNGATVKIYLDGADVTGTVSNATLADNLNNLRICGYFGGILALTGYIDEMALYATELTQAQVQAHYAAASAGRLTATISSLGWLG